MTSDEQKAWDGFAAATMIPLIQWGMKGNQSPKDIMDEAVMYADGMMSRRNVKIKAENDKPIF